MMPKMPEHEFQEKLKLIRAIRGYNKLRNSNKPSKRNVRKPMFNSFRPIRASVELETLFIPYDKFARIPVTEPRAQRGN